MSENIIIKGAREHNLKNINLELPRDRLIVITGLSGSGKSSLAFDTIYAEGQRRYVESLSSYARQFLGQMEKPEVDSISGLSPAISIDQKTTSKNPRSTVGTVTEIHDYLRVLFARAGVPHCINCGKPIERTSIDQMIDHVISHEMGQRILILAPVVRAKKGEHQKVLSDLIKSGYTRVRVDGEMRLLEEDIKLIKNNKHTIEVVIDRIRVKEDSTGRLADSIETSLKLSEGIVIIQDVDSGHEQIFNENYSCPDCGISIDEISPRLFSFNSPFGACPECSGLGVIMKIDENLVVHDDTLSIEEGAVKVSGWNLSIMDKFNRQKIAAVAKYYGFSLKTPWKDLPESARHVILYGTGDVKIPTDYVSPGATAHFEKEFEGIIPNLERRFAETESEGIKVDISRYMYETPCQACHGKRYRPEALAVKLGGINIAELSDMPIYKIKEFLASVKLTEKQQLIASRVLKEINARLDFLIDVGLSYLTLSRSAGSLSGGESQRIRLATQIGSGLMGVLYILDEPSIGLHQRDNSKLLSTLKNLRDLGNTLLIVEHDEETMQSADYIVDIGPGAGMNGGQIVATGTPAEVAANKNSITGDYLSGRKFIPLPSERRQPNGRFIGIRGACEHNLKHLDVDIPVGLITVVTGVSGSGKSTLINEVLYKNVAGLLNHTHIHGGACEKIVGIEHVDKVVNIDQSPIGRTPRSNPATYTGVFDFIRDLFAMTKDAKIRGYQKGRFSFNVKGGRCEACKGDGIIKVEMHFLPDVYVPCEVCKGKRYTAETLQVRYKEKNIYEVLDMTVDEAYDFFYNIPKIEPILRVLKDVGLGYIKLGQPSTTLSGGEAQRIKLATHLSKRQTGKTLFILDEPTTGLHSHDVRKLIDILTRLCEKGNSIVVIEHNMDVIKCADYIIDLGPEGGDNGGTLVACGTPEEIAKIPESYTGQYLTRWLSQTKKLMEESSSK